MVATDFNLTIRPSRRLHIASTAVHLLACVAVLLAELAVWFQGVALVAVVASLVNSLRPASVLGLRCQADGGLAIRLDGDWLTVAIAPVTVVLSWLVVLRYRRTAAAREETVVILPDGLDRDDFRRLRVWLKWRARLEGGMEQVSSGAISP